MWTRGVPVEDAAQAADRATRARLPIVFPHIALSCGPTCTTASARSIGSVIPTVRATFIPAAVGVDIGCWHARLPYRPPPPRTCPTTWAAARGDRAGGPPVRPPAGRARVRVAWQAHVPAQVDAAWLPGLRDGVSSATELCAALPSAAGRRRLQPAATSASPSARATTSLASCLALDVVDRARSGSWCLRSLARWSRWPAPWGRNLRRRSRPSSGPCWPDSSL